MIYVSGNIIIVYSGNEAKLNYIEPKVDIEINNAIMGEKDLEIQLSKNIMIKDCVLHDVKRVDSYQIIYKWGTL